MNANRFLWWCFGIFLAIIALGAAAALLGWWPDHPMPEQLP